MSVRLPTYFVSHGGGPWPFMKEQYGATYDILEQSLVGLPRQIGGKPKAVRYCSLCQCETKTKQRTVSTSSLSPHH